ncbi:MAG: hypothetical protein J5483_00230 [Lachnospiraceae bacterium]|nr:hypothetical protein [Lachnospiraceae bacterium]
MRLFILICLTLIAHTIGYSGLFKKKFEECLPLSIFGSILILYVAGLFARLRLGVVVVIGISCILFLAGLTKSLIKKQMKEFVKNVFSVGFVIFLLSLAFIYYMTAGRLLSRFDEFTHWGLTVKNYILFDGFANVEGSTTHGAGYQPGISLFCYLFTALRRYMNECDVLQAMNIYTVAMLLPIFRKITWKRIVIGIFMIPLVYVLPWLFSSSIVPFNTLYVDCAMAVTFGSMLLHYYTHEQEGFNYFGMMLYSAAIILVKPGSEFFALMIFGMVFLDVLLFRRREFGQMCKKHAGWIMPIVYVLVSAASYLSWKFFTAKNQMLQVFDYIEVTEENRVTADTILESFKEALFRNTRNGSFRVSYVLWLAIFAVIAVFIILLAKGRGEKGRLILSSILVILGYIVYAGALLFMYVYLFTDYEGEHLASMDRYMYTYILGALVFFVYLLVYWIITRFGGFGNILILIPVGIVLALAPWKKLTADMITCQDTISKTMAKRMEYEFVEQLPKKLDPEKDRVYFICQDSNGYEYQVSYYLATPVKLSYDYAMGWSLGTPYDEEDVWTLDMTAEEWEKALLDGNYTYVYVYNADKQFRALYGDLFENSSAISDNTCYKIEKKNGHVLLVRAF